MNTKAMFDLIEKELDLLDEQAACGMLDEEHLAERKKEMEEKKKKLVESVHHHAISAYTTKEKDRGERTRWSTRVPDPTKSGGLKWLRAGSEDELYEKLYQFYGLSQKKPDLTLAGLYEKWIAYRKAKVALNTVKRDRATWKRYYEGDPITTRPLAKIKPSEAFVWISDKVKAGCLTRRQYTDMCGIWRSIEGFAYADDMITRRIMKDLPAPERSLFKDTPPRYKETATLSGEEIKKLTAAAYDLYDRSRFNVAYLGLALDCYLGLRAGELSCLRWDGIDSKAKAVRITQSEVPRIVEENDQLYARGYDVVDHLKAHHRKRVVPLPAEAAAILTRIRKECLKKGISSEYVFVQANGDRVHTRAFQRAIQRAYVLLGWQDVKTGGVHEFRRTYATAIHDVVGDKATQDYMGHKDYTTTMQNYITGSEAPAPDAAEAISRALRQA